LLIWCVWIISLILHNSICCLQCVRIYFSYLENLPTFDATQANEWSYCDWHPTYRFLFLTIEIFWCLHKQVHVFLHNCGNAIGNFKKLDGPPLCILVFFFRSKNFNHVCKQASSILSQMVSLTTSWLPPLQNTHPITMTACL
jgi:hypothetical protein